MKVACPECQARYKLPDEAAGRRMRCAKCGAKFAVAALVPAAVQADPFELEDLSQLARGESVGPPPDLAAARAAAESAEEASAPGSRKAERGPGIGSQVKDYVTAIGRSLVFFRTGGNLLSFVFALIVVLLTVPARYAPCLGVGAVAIINGWFMAFQINTLQNASAGEPEIGELSIADGFWESVIKPTLIFLFTALISLVPFIAGLVGMMASQKMNIVDVGMVMLLVMAREPGLMTQGQETMGMLLIGALIFSQVIWPILLLCVVVGGFGTVIRADLMIRTILYTLPGYAILLVVCLVCWFLPAIIGAAVESPADDDESAAAAPLGLELALTGLGVYLAVVQMRSIGLFYHHFKRRFAWDWG